MPILVLPKSSRNVDIVVTVLNYKFTFLKLMFFC